MVQISPIKNQELVPVEFHGDYISSSGHSKSVAGLSPRFKSILYANCLTLTPRCVSVVVVESFAQWLHDVIMTKLTVVPFCVSFVQVHEYSLFWSLPYSARSFGCCVMIYCNTNLRLWLFVWNVCSAWSFHSVEHNFSTLKCVIYFLTAFTVLKISLKIQLQMSVEQNCHHQ